jgi:basic amino acid/polyamine antiporter, APA family
MSTAQRAAAPAPQIGFWIATALVVGNMIGSGIFLLPSALAPFGADNLTGWVLTAAGGITLGLVFGWLSRAIAGAGGPYAYTRAAFGDVPAFAVAWGYWISIWIGNAAIATGAVGYTGQFLPWMVRTPFHTAVSTLGFVWALTFVNCLGIRAAGSVQAVTTVVKLMPLVAAVALLVVRAPSGAALAPAHFTLGGTASVATLALWAMLGLESATIPADKVKGSAATVMRATVWGTAATAILSAVACAAVLLLVPSGTLSTSTAPFADLARFAWSDTAARAVAVCAAVSALGALNGWTLLQGELPRAMAADGLFPRVFARTSRNGTPVTALVATSGLVTVFVLLNLNRSLVGVFTFFILLSTTAALVAYLACSLALVRLGSSAGARTLGVVGTLYSAGALVGAGREAVLWGSVLLAASLPAYAAIHLIGSRFADTPRD